MNNYQPAQHRLLSFCLSAVLTLVMLGGIDHLAQLEQAEGLWAAVPAVVAPA